MRRTTIFGLGIVVGAVVSWPLEVFGFLAIVLHPIFWAFLGAVVVSAGWVIGRAWRDLRDVDQAMRSMEETVLLDVDAIAAYRPPPRRHPMDARWWRRVRGRASRTKETVL